jgi:pyruvate formate lyase activating enzyme
VDLLHFDLKHMDSSKHREVTGQPNELILDNLKKVLSVKAPQDVIIRIPVIPGCNDSLENIEATARFVADLGFEQIELVPYHRLGVSKYAQYGIIHPFDESEPISQNYLKDLIDMVGNFGLQEITGQI